MWGLLGAAIVFVASQLVLVLVDRGGREHLKLVLLRRFIDDEPITELQAEMIGAGIRTEDASVHQGLARRYSLWLVVAPHLLGWVLALGAVVLLGLPAWMVAIVLGLKLGLAGAFDGWVMKRNGMRRPDRRKASVRLAIALAVLVKIVFAVGAAYAVLAGAAALAEGSWLSGLVSMLVALPLVASAHRVLYGVERWARRSDRGIFAADANDTTLLLLRSFVDDSTRLRSMFGALGPARPIVPGGRVRFEEFFASLLAKEGELVAIGRPGERLPELGAARTYWPDEQWRDAVRETAHRCKAVFIIAGSTSGLTWELEQLKAWGLLPKVFVIFPPDTVEDSDARIAQVSGTLSGRWLRWDESPAELITAMTIDEQHRPRFFLTVGRDWAGYMGTVTYVLEAWKGRAPLDTLQTQIRQQWAAATDDAPLPPELGGPEDPARR